MKNETKAKILANVNKAYNKVMAVGCSAATAIGAASVTSFAEEGVTDTTTSSASSLSDALASVDPNVVLSGFYDVLPTVLTIALPIIGAKVALNFLFGSVKGA